MAIYHCNVKIIGRSSGRSSVAAVAYRAGIKMKNERDGVLHDYSHKRGVEYSEIMLPIHAPREYEDRAVLWSTVEKGERRSDAQTAREVEVALPVEFSLYENIKVLREYIIGNFVAEGMIADFSIHDTGKGNPHAHIMLTMRDISPYGFDKKNRDWNDKTRLEKWRESWADVCNRKLNEKGVSSRIDHRSLEEQGLERTPTIHTGYSTERKERNKEIIRENAMYEPHAVVEFMNELNNGCEILQREIRDIQFEDNQKKRELLNIQTNIRDINRRRDELARMDNNRLQAIEERESMGIFKSKREINAKIEMLDNAYKQAWNGFVRNFGVDPNSAHDEVARLDDKCNAIALSCYNVDLTPYYEWLHILGMEHKRQRILAEIRLDGEEILEQLGYSRLNHITHEDYREIIPQLRQNQVDILREKLNNRRREREYHIRERNHYERGR